MKLPEVLDNKVIMPEGPVTILKIGNRDEPEYYNQATQYAMTGSLWTNSIEPGQPVGIGSFRTSRVRSIYVHKSDSGFDKLMLPKDFPDATDLRFPEELKEGDVLVGTMNSIYWIQPGRPDIPNNIGHGGGDSMSMINGTNPLNNTDGTGTRGIFG